jgi:S1-C subfamily serine protease
MPLRIRLCVKLFALVLVASWCDAAGGQTAAPAKPDPSGSLYKVLRSVSGASGHEENSRYVMDDARSVFTAGKDPKVTVYFEWEGPPGAHHFEGLWKSPEGRIVLISDFRYEAKTPHFNGYWSMLLSEATPSGEWDLEARIDGEPAGAHSFVVTSSPAAVPAVAAPRLLSSAELYKKALEATVTIEKIAGDGTILGKGKGFWVADGQLLTAFDIIDGAASLRISLKDGTRLTTDQVIAWNRWQDWALLKVDSSGKTWLKRGSKDAPSVGDRCVFLEEGPAGAKLADGSITGKNAFAKAGERLLVASIVTPISFGGPLLDEFGNYVGILGGSIVPGGDPVKTLGLLSEPGATNGTLDMEMTGLAVPHTLFPESAAGGTGARLAEIAARGEFLSTVVKSDSIQYATLTSAVTKDPGNSISPKGFKRVFSRRENKATVYVNWQTTSKEKLICILRVFGTDNTLLSEAKPREVSLGPGKYVATTWDMTIGAMPTGIYRVDLILNGKTGWRDFFRITE